MMINFENMAIQTEMKILSIDKDGVRCKRYSYSGGDCTFDDAKISAKGYR